MKRRYILIIWSILLTLLPLLNGCIREEEFDNTPQGNFEALWKIIDEQYCFLDYKQIDWDAIHDKYQPLITSGMSYDGLFEILGNMLAELKDGHVNLYSSSNMARYWDWYLDYPRNFNESIIEKYLGRDYRIAGGAKYTILEDNIGYIYYGDFSSGIGNGNLDEILLYLSACNGLIIDVRNNGGGNLTNATRMAAGRYHDALKLGYAKNAHQLHFILAFNQNKEKAKGGTYYYDGAQPYKNMQTLWYHYAAQTPNLDVSLLFMNLGLETGDAETETSHTRYLQTFGTYVTYQPESGNWLPVQAAFYYQTGKNKNAQSVSAFMVSVKAAYAIDKQWSVSLGYDYLSGSDGKGDKFKAFDPLYGTHHKFYGAMDYFYASAWQGVAPGLQDAQLGVNFKTSKQVSMQLNYHYFATAAKLDDVKKGLGLEMDYQLDWNVMKDVKLSAGYSIMRGTKSMDVVKGGDHKRWQDWGWVSVNINPRILFVKW